MIIERNYLGQVAALDDLADLLCRLLLDSQDERVTGEQSAAAPASRSSCFSVQPE